MCIKQALLRSGGVRLWTGAHVLYSLLTGRRLLLVEKPAASDAIDIVPIYLTLIVIKLLLGNNGLLL